MLVYVLSTYGEYGAEDACATLNINCVRDLMHKHYPWANQYHENRQLDKAIEVNVVDKYELSDAWGGIQLHIIELEDQ